VITPTNSKYDGEIIDDNNIVVVSIIRAGDSMLDTFLNIVPNATIGKILIQRDEATAKPVLFYSKLPELSGRKVIIVDPMLASGGSAKCAIDILLEKGVDINNLYFFCVLAAPEGTKMIHQTYPGHNILNPVLIFFADLIIYFL